MSNAMSRSKSRWKAVLLATVATATVAPLAEKAHAGMTVGVYANPLGGTSPNVYSGTSNVYIDPYDTDTLYVYATVTGSSAPSASYVDGLNYLYFNVNASTVGATGLGNITAATPGSLFGGGNFNQTTTNPGAGAQGGAFEGNVYTSISSIAVGSNASIGSIAKPRSAGDVYWSSPTGSGMNVVVSGTSVSFLVETLTYTPASSNITNGVATTPTAPNSVSFNVSIPSATLASAGSEYVATNYFQGLGSTPTLGSQPSVTQTAGYTASASTIKLTQAIPGDVNLDGNVDIQDFNVLNGVFNSSVSGGWTAGDLNDSGAVDIQDFNILNGNFNAGFNIAPSAIATNAAEYSALVAQLGISSVPEPTSGFCWLVVQLHRFFADVEFGNNFTNSLLLMS